MNIAHFEKIIEAVYSAVDDSTRWPNALNLIASAVQAKCAMLFGHGHNGSELLASVNAHPIIWNPLMTIIAEDECIKRVLMTPVGQVFTNDGILPLDQYRETRFYQTIGRPYDCVQLLGAVIDRQTDMGIIISFHRAENADRFDESNRCLLEAVIPHLRRSLNLRRHLLAADQRVRCLEETFDRMPYGLFLIDDHGRIVFANRVGNLLLASGDLGCRSGRLINAGRRTLPCGLAEALDRALGSGGAVAMADGCLIGRRNDALRPLHVLAFPLGRDIGFLTRVEGCARAAVLVLDPEFSPEGGVEHLLARLYSLTRAEAKVALQVIAGNRPATIADDFHVNIETVKTQLKAVFQKTDTTGQSELVRTLLPLAMIANMNVV